MKQNTASQLKETISAATPVTLAAVIASLEGRPDLSETRRRDLRSAVKRVAHLLGNAPEAVPLAMDVIRNGLATVNPMAHGMSPKRFTNLRSDFLAAVRSSGLIPATKRNKGLSPSWAALLEALSARRAHIGLSRLAHYASGKGIHHKNINDEAINGFIAAVRDGSLHQKPNALHRQVTLIWNEAARDPSLGLSPVTAPSFRGPAERIDWWLLPPSFREDTDKYLDWCGGSDPFAADARSRPLATTTLRLTRQQIHTAASALIDAEVDINCIKTLGDLITPENFKSILRQRLKRTEGELRSFEHYLARALIRIASEWVKVDASILVELKRLASKLPAPKRQLTPKNMRFLRQFDDPQSLKRLRMLPEQLWKEVKQDANPSFRTLAKAQAALAIAIPTFMPVRPENLNELEFDVHLFVREGRGATSTLEINAEEVKNNEELAFDIPPHIVKMLIGYRDCVAPSVIGHRPTRIFVNADGTPKSQSMVAVLITSYARKRAGIILTPHQFRHLGAKIILDANPGAFSTVQHLLGQKSLKTTMIYAGINKRRAARHHYALIELAVAAQMPQRKRKKD
jgi:integrase